MKTLFFLILALTATSACRDRATASSAPVVAAMPTARSAEVKSRVPAIEACALLTAAEVESIFGRLKSDPKSEIGLRNDEECRYQNVDGQWLKTCLYSAGRWDLEKGFVSSLQAAPISTLGDEAFSVKQGTDSVVYVRKGGDVLEVSCSCGLPKARAIAAKAIVRL